MADPLPTTHFDLRTIAVGCVYLLLNKATLYFPGTNRSGPSHKVIVDLGSKTLLRPSDRVYFPFFVYWGAWHDAVKPVLDDKAVQVIVRDNPSLRVQLNKSLIDHQQYDELLSLMERRLLDSFARTGYLPIELSPTVTAEEELEEATTSEASDTPDGEPIVQNPAGPTGPDVDNLYWPDGTKKLVYNIVDAE